VVGGGAAGFQTAKLCSQAGARVALIEHSLVGGSCYTSVLIQTLHRIASIANDVRHSEEFGIKVRSQKIDFAKVMDKV
jgi:dihydrolipoamide dehydrogenase